MNEFENNEFENEINDSSIISGGISNDGIEIFESTIESDGEKESVFTENVKKKSGIKKNTPPVFLFPSFLLIKK